MENKTEFKKGDEVVMLLKIKYAEAVNRYNNPDSIFLGDITKWKEHTDISRRNIKKYW